MYVSKVGDNTEALKAIWKAHPRWICRSTHHDDANTRLHSSAAASVRPLTPRVTILLVSALSAKRRLTQYPSHPHVTAVSVRDSPSARRGPHVNRGQRTRHTQSKQATKGLRYARDGR
uniref:Uncharacterized protein n=1 Tax=Knipowitschia caucasica TaxID=637954 RepID=A0AAV2KIL2_KNICA